MTLAESCGGLGCFLRMKWVFGGRITWFKAQEIFDEDGTALN